jgi:hypothetical protein
VYFTELLLVHAPNFGLAVWAAQPRRMRTRRCGAAARALSCMKWTAQGSGEHARMRLSR